MFTASASSDPAQSQRKLSRGNQLLNAGQLADALSEYHAAIGTFFLHLTTKVNKTQLKMVLYNTIFLSLSK